MEAVEPISLRRPLVERLLQRLVGDGRVAGVELDLAVPAIEAGADLPADSGIGRLPAAGVRAAAFAGAATASSRSRISASARSSAFA